MSETEAQSDATSPGGREGAGPSGSDALRKRRRWRRRLLLALGPLVVVVAGGLIYLNSGRYIETENAYVKSDSVLISAEVSGPIENVSVRENQHVRAGDLLFQIDGKQYQLVLARGKAQLAAVESFIESLEASYQQQVEQLQRAKIDRDFYARELERQQSLLTRSLGSEADVDSARHDFDVAAQQIPIIEQGLAQLRAQIGGKIVSQASLAAPNTASYFDGNAAYRTVEAMIEEAKLNLERTSVRAPFDGVVSRVPTVGHHVTAGIPVLSLVSDHGVWIEANYKETELTHVEPEQDVTIHVDTYPDHVWHGKVETISPATGSEFAVIPAQNASGNWVKVAQRIPVRISVDIRPGDPELRAGMSTVVEIDTRYRRPVPRFLRFLQVARASSPARTPAD